MAKDYQLKGKNFCGLSCVDQESVIHPETCIDNTLMSCESNESFSLKNWILGSASPERELKGSLFEWLQNYYSGNVAFTLEPATASTLGGIKVGQYLFIDNAVLSVDKESLNISEDISDYLEKYYTLPAATHTFNGGDDEYNLGGVNIFYEWPGKKDPIQEPENGIDIYGGTVQLNVGEPDPITITLSNPIEYNSGTIIPAQGDYYLFPVDIIKRVTQEDEVPNENSLIVTIPTSMFNQPVVRYDINQGLDNNAKQQARTNIGAGTSSFSGNYNDLTNKPSLAAVATSGNYSDLDGRPFVPTVDNERTIKGPTYTDNTWSWSEIETIIDITYTGNAVANLGVISEGGVTLNTAEGALSILLSTDCKFKNITLYIANCTTGEVALGDSLRLDCFRNTTNFTYTVNDNNYQFVFRDDITRVDMFKNDDTITLYVSAYNNYTGEA